MQSEDLLPTESAQPLLPHYGSELDNFEEEDEHEGNHDDDGDEETVAHSDPEDEEADLQDIPQQNEAEKKEIITMIDTLEEDKKLLEAKAVDESPSIQTDEWVLTLEQIVEKVTGDYTGSDLPSEFILTYRSFCTPLQFIVTLIKRFKETNSEAVRLRCINMLRSWVFKFWEDFAKDKTTLIVAVEDFYQWMDTKYPKLKLPLALVRDKILQRSAQNYHPKEAEIQMDDVPTPLPVHGKIQNILSIPPLELARQMTLIDQEQVRQIKPWEFIDNAWTKPNKSELAPELSFVIQRFNKVSRWVQSVILTEMTTRKRTRVLGLLLNVCLHLRALNNFNGLLQILSGLRAAPVLRLKKTYKYLDAPQRQALKLMVQQEIIKPTALHQLLARAVPPLVPYIGMYLTDITMIDAGNPDIIDGRINYSKRRLLAKVLMSLQSYQQIPYQLHVVPEIRDWLSAELEKPLYESSVLMSFSKYLEPDNGKRKNLPMPKDLQELNAKRKTASTDIGNSIIAKTRKIKAKRHDQKSARGPQRDPLSDGNSTEESEGSSDKSKAPVSTSSHQKKKHKGVKHKELSTSKTPSSSEGSSANLDNPDGILERFNEKEAVLLSSLSERENTTAEMLTQVISRISELSALAEKLRQEAGSDAPNALAEQELANLRTLAKHREDWIPRDVHESEVAQLRRRLAELEQINNPPPARLWAGTNPLRISSNSGDTKRHTTATTKATIGRKIPPNRFAIDESQTKETDSN